jgi:gliding motility-associated-like protein
MLYNPFLGGTMKTKLKVSNPGCTDSTEVLIDMGPELKPAFDVDTIICPYQSAVFKNTSAGDIVSWLWEFGNGNMSILENPPHQYYPGPVNNSAIAKLSVTDNMGCVNIVTQKISLPNNCDILVPNTFTPDGNGLNDYLYPVNIRNMVTYSFRILNRYGVTVFQTTDKSKKWDGNYKGKKADPGVYVWIIHCIDAAGRIIDERGSTLLLR